MKGSEWKGYVEQLNLNLWIRVHWQNDVPMCVSAECALYDGKRCALIGEQPESVCIPAVGRMGGQLNAFEEADAEAKS